MVADSCSVWADIYAAVRDFHRHFQGFDGSDQLAYVARPNCGISLLIRFVFKIFVTASGNKVGQLFTEAAMSSC